jgi:hypothetical protein
MSYGYAPRMAHVMTWESIKQIVPAAAAHFESKLGDHSVDEFCRAYVTGDAWPVSAKSWDALKRAVEKATAVRGKGLVIEPDYHDPDDGGPYDDGEANDGFFVVTNAVAPTPAAKKFGQFIAEALWTEVG